VSDQGISTDVVLEFDVGTTPDVASDQGSPDPGQAVEDLQEPPVEVARATCEAYVGGHVQLTTEHNVEAFPNYDEELTALDLASLPDGLQLSNIGLIQRSIVAYMLEIDLDLLPETMLKDDLLAIEPLGKAVLGAFAEQKRKGHQGVDLIFLRRGLHRFYQCARAFPLRLEDFRKAIYDYSEIVPYDVHSVPKNRTRRLYEDHDLGIYVAETIADDDAVRETEIQLTKNRVDKAIDFVVYDGDGNLMDRSEFVTTVGSDIGGASPYGCISCHFEAGTFRINVVFPDMDPVAPQ
jgi:hypothetical protein